MGSSVVRPGFLQSVTYLFGATLCLGVPQKIPYRRGICRSIQISPCAPTVRKEIALRHNLLRTDGSGEKIGHLDRLMTRLIRSAASVRQSSRRKMEEPPNHNPLAGTVGAAMRR
jgi:hypothetical protein